VRSALGGKGIARHNGQGDSEVRRILGDEKKKVGERKRIKKSSAKSLARLDVMKGPKEGLSKEKPTSRRRGKKPERRSRTKKNHTTRGGKEMLVFTRQEKCSLRRHADSWTTEDVGWESISFEKKNEATETRKVHCSEREKKNRRVAESSAA